ncbi:MAG: TonB-dependent receptor [Bryobacteraceae bacterium]
MLSASASAERAWGRRWKPSCPAIDSLRARAEFNRQHRHRRLSKIRATDFSNGETRPERLQPGAGLVLQRGRHLIKTGALAERYQDNMVNPTFALGVFTFNDLTSFVQNRPARFLGLAPNGALDRYWRFTLFGLYIQDDIKLNSRLTLNAGVRYEFSTQPVDIYGRDSALINLTDREPTVGQLYKNPTYKNVSPRIALPGMCLGTANCRSVRGTACTSIRTINKT